MSENDVATGDGLLLGLFHTTLGRGITAEKGIIKLAWDVGDGLTLDLEDNFVNDLKIISAKGFLLRFWYVVEQAKTVRECKSCENISNLPA